MADTETLAAKIDIDDINQDMLPGLTQEILEVSKIMPKRGESPLDLTKKAVKKLTDPKQTSDDDWDRLSDRAQRLINSAHIRSGEGENPILLLSLEEEEVEESSDEDRTSSDEEEEKVEMTTEAQTAAKGSNGSKAATAAQAAKATKAEKASKAAKPAKAEKAVKDAKPAKAEKATKGSKTASERVFGRGRGSPFPVDSKIRVINKEPGFRKGTVRDIVFSKYKTGMTVGEAREAGVPYNHMRWHVEQGWVEVK